MKRVITGISQWMALTLIVADRFAKRPNWRITVTLSEPPKTWEQLGYLHSEVLPKLTIALSEAGDIERKSERQAKYWLKREIRYGEFYNFNGSVIFDADSFEKASIEVLINAIDTAIHAAEQRGIYIAPPRKTTLTKEHKKCKLSK